MFKFNFGQILDYPLELEDDDGMTDDEEEIIVSPILQQDHLQTNSTHSPRRPQDVCEEISLDTLVCTRSNPNTF